MHAVSAPHNTETRHIIERQGHTAVQSFIGYLHRPQVRLRHVLECLPVEPVLDAKHGSLPAGLIKHISPERLVALPVGAARIVSSSRMCHQTPIIPRSSCGLVCTQFPQALVSVLDWL